MSLSSAQKIGVGALLGGVGSVGTSMVLRYWADNKGTSTTPGQVDFPILWEHAPLIGIAGGAVATWLAYYLWGTEAAVAAGMTALIAGVAPEADSWVTQARSDADLEAAKAPADAPPGGLRGSDARVLMEKLASLEAELASVKAAA